MDKKEMTKLQEQIYEFLKEAILENGYPPSVREIAKFVGFNSPSSAQSQLNKLIEMGYITRDPNSPRSILINDESFNLSRRIVINVPILKDAIDINNIFADENIVDFLPFPEDVIGSDEYFIVVIHGEDMKNAAILDGDKLLIHKQETAESEDIVIVYVDNIIMIRRLIKENNGYKLVAENESVKPIFVERLRIIGKVVGVLRKI